MPDNLRDSVPHTAGKLLLSDCVLLPNLPLVSVVADLDLQGGQIHKNVGQFKIAMRYFVLVECLQTIGQSLNDLSQLAFIKFYFLLVQLL